MTSEQTDAKAAILESLHESGREVLGRLRELPPEAFEEGRYENGWNGRQILAHVAAIEWTYPRLIDIARDGAPPAASEQPSQVRRTEPEEAKGLPTRTAQGGIESYNDRVVEKRAGASVAELLDEFETNRAATIAVVEAADGELFGRQIRSAGGITGALADVLYAVAVAHVLAHAGDILGEQLTSGMRAG
ncbi:MAG: DinB family protein [Dehalococcoidia bacterium]